jgi:hypothetical protein
MTRRSSRRSGRPRSKGLRGGQTGRALPPLTEKKKRQNQDTQKDDRIKDALRYLPALGQDQSCLQRDLLDPGLRRRYRRLASSRLQRRLRLGRPRRRGATCPGDVTTAEGTTSRTAGTGTCSWGTCGSACPLRVTPIISAKGSSTPSDRLRSLGQDPGVPGPNTGGASPPGGWLDAPGLASDLD